MAKADAPRPPKRSSARGEWHFDADYREETRLRDGTRVVLRLVRPDDKPKLVQGLEHLSDESRYLRFFTSKPRFTSHELRYLTEVDQERHVALGAVRLGPDGEEDGLGIARFIVFQDEPEVAEAAVAVVDDMQGKSLGRLLFLRLIAAALERGVRQFRAEVLSENRTMRKFVRGLDPAAEEHDDGECIVLTLHLPQVAATAPAAGEAARGPIYGLLRLVAERMVTIRRALDDLLPR